MILCHFYMGCTWTRPSSCPVEVLVLLSVTVKLFSLRGDNINGLDLLTSPTPALYRD